MWSFCFIPNWLSLASMCSDEFRLMRASSKLGLIVTSPDIHLEHIKWCLALGIPILVFWVTSLPIIALILMYKNVRIEDEHNIIQKYFLILYQGLKTKHFYWEFVNSSRKILILIAFLLPTEYQIMFSLVTLITTWRLQSYLLPYKDNDNNEVEILGVNVGIITLS